LNYAKKSVFFLDPNISLTSTTNYVSMDEIQGYLLLSSIKLKEVNDVK